MLLRQVVIVTAFLGGAVACVRNAARGEGVLAGAPPNAQLGRDSVRNAFAPLAAGAFSRVLFRNTDAPTFSVEIREVEIAPRASADRLTFAGSALVEVRAGSGRISSASLDVALVLGVLVAVPDGESLSIRNEAAEPLSLRLYLIASK